MGAGWRHVWMMAAAVSTAAGPVHALRILPAGDSITLGLGSTGNNTSYRAPLADLLDTEYPQLAYEFVGTVGPSPLWHEGYSGYEADPFTINGMDEWISESEDNLKLELLGTLPTIASGQGLASGEDVADVVLLHIGTNTMKLNGNNIPDIFDESPEYAFAQFEQLLETMLTHERLDETPIIVARIIPRMKETNFDKREEINERVNTYNAMIDDLFAGLADGDNTDLFDPYADRLLLVDMNEIPGIIWGTDTDGDGILDTKNTTYLPDGEHPSDAGYEGMAGVWFDALEANGFLSEALIPGDVDGDGDVDLDDYNTLSSNMYQATAGGPADGDFNEDGVVSFEDFITLALHFGQSVAETPASLSVPEPASALLAGALACLLPPRARAASRAG